MAEKTKKSAAEVDEKTEPTSGAGGAPRYDKISILTMSRYQHRRDLLAVLLVDNKTYTHKQVNEAIERFVTKGKVK